jgi:hypothetical protein
LQPPTTASVGHEIMEDFAKWAKLRRNLGHQISRKLREIVACTNLAKLMNKKQFRKITRNKQIRKNIKHC